MILRMEARISSIEGSCPFAGCVIDRVPPQPAGVGAPAANFGISAIRWSARTMAWPEANASKLVRAESQFAFAMRESALSSVRRAHAAPGVAHLLVVRDRIV